VVVIVVVVVVVLSLQQWTVRTCLLISPAPRVLVLVYRWVRVCQAGRLSCSADEVTANKDLCGVYKKEFNEKQRFLRYSGSCSSRFLQTCLRVNDNEYSTYSAICECTYQCDSCRKKPGAGRRDDAPRRSAPKAVYIIVIFSFAITLIWTYMLILNPFVPTFSASINWQKIWSILS
jgi:hypothetical protein